MTEPLALNRRRFLVAGSAALAVAACSGAADDDPSTAEATPETTTSTTSTTTTIDPALRATAPLTGVVGPFKPKVGRAALVVKVDNHEDARPQLGIDRADVIVEEQVESGISRLVSVFHSRTPPEIGPIRSTRSTDFDIIPLFGRPVYASSGGNEGVMNGLAAVDKIDVGHNRGGTGFRRISRPGPHNLVADPEALYGRAGDAADTPPAPIFDFLAEAERLHESRREIAEASVRMGARTLVRWRWNQTTRSWDRLHGSTLHKTNDGARRSPTHVVILQVPYERGGGVGRSIPHGVTTGSGPAHVLVSRRVVAGTWSRPTPAGRFDLRTEDGTVMKLKPGQTVIQLPQTGANITFS